MIVLASTATRTGFVHETVTGDPFVVNRNLGTTCVQIKCNLVFFVVDIVTNRNIPKNIRCSAFCCIFYSETNGNYDIISSNNRSRIYQKCAFSISNIEVVQGFFFRKTPRAFGTFQYIRIVIQLDRSPRSIVFFRRNRNLKFDFLSANTCYGLHGVNKMIVLVSTATRTGFVHETVIGNPFVVNRNFGTS